MLGLSVPTTGVQRTPSRTWKSASSSPRDSTINMSLPQLPRHSAFLSNESLVGLHRQPSAAERRSSLPPDSTLAQVSNAMAADVSFFFFKKKKKRFPHSHDFSFYNSVMRCWLPLICYLLPITTMLVRDHENLEITEMEKKRKDYFRGNDNSLISMYACPTSIYYISLSSYFACDTFLTTHTFCFGFSL
jgi:hypothetical protein